jgi:hypothetical protein
MSCAFWGASDWPSISVPARMTISEDAAGEV